MIKDSYGRTLNYLRLAVTDRCNLRCTYCMPKEGLDWLPNKELMTNEEMLKLCSVFVNMGVEKIRITGGEPFVRKDFLPLLEDLSQLKGLRELSLTTNGLLTAPWVPELKRLGISTVNLSLDTLDKDRFFQITRRNSFGQVMKTLDALLSHGIDVKINAVVMENINTADIIPMVRLTEKLPVSVRFIEEMPFNGSDQQVSLTWDHFRILELIREAFPSIYKTVDPPHSTAYNYKIPGHIGEIGIIAAYTRSFCGSCNRIRITPTGMLRTCLYDQGIFNMKDALREGRTDEELENRITQAILKKAETGWEAENNRDQQETVHESMATIGG